MTTSLDLMQDVYANFLDAYGTQAAQGLVTIGFEPLGIMPGLDPAAPGAGAAALEFVSINADALPELGGGSYMATGRTISGTYRMMLASAQPVAGADITGFNALKANAVEMTDNGALGSSLGPYTFYPTFAAPANWYDPACEANWIKYAFTVGQNAPTPSPPPGPTPPHHIFMPLQNAQAWRLMTVQPQPVYAAAPTVAPSAATVQPHATVSPAVIAAAYHPAPMLAQHAIASTTMVPLHATLAAPLVANNSSPQPKVRSSRSSLSRSTTACCNCGAPGGAATSWPIRSGTWLERTQATMRRGRLRLANPPRRSSRPRPRGRRPPPSLPARAARRALFVDSCRLHRHQEPGDQLDRRRARSVDHFQRPPLSGLLPCGAAQTSTNSLTNPGSPDCRLDPAPPSPCVPPATDPALIPPTASDTASSVVSTAVGVLEGLLGGHGTPVSLP